MHAISQRVSSFAGIDEKKRRHSESGSQQDVKVLVTLLSKERVYSTVPDRVLLMSDSSHFSQKKSSIFDVMNVGHEKLSIGQKYSDFLARTTHDPSLGFPIGVLEAAPGEDTEAAAHVEHLESAFDQTEQRFEVSGAVEASLFG